MDTGATHNYCTSEYIGHGKKMDLEKPIHIKSIHNHEIVKSYYRINLLSEQHIFYEVENLGKFDMILGMKGLRKIGAKIDTKTFELIYKKSEHETKETVNYIINEEVESDFKNIIHGLMERNNADSTLPFNTEVRATIRTSDDEPIWSKQYPYPISCSNFVNSEIEKLLNKGIIRQSRSPYSSPVWVVPKKGSNDDGTPKQRLVIDYRKLNLKTITDRYPMPDTNMILGNLGKAGYFSTIDLESGYHQIMIRESDKEKTAFSINGAKYEFNRMPFGLKNAPSIFQRTIDDILRAYIGKFAHVYIDDVLVYSKTREEHVKHLQIIMETLCAANMKISDEKSKFFMQKVEFLGHIIANGRIRVDQKKVETIDNYPIPQSLRQLRSFLGLAGYYRKFVRDYAAIAKPLTIYLQGENGMISAKKSANVKLELDEQAKNAFEKIKGKLRENIELFQPDYAKPFELTTDASNYAVGAVLSQLNKPIIFISRTLNSAEKNYATNEKEALAIVWALQHLRNYIYGIADLTIYTDHQPLTFAISEKNPNLKIKRWKAMIEESGAKLVYKPGKQNVVADALSRQYCNALDSESEGTMHSRESSQGIGIPKTNEPLNVHRTQIELEHSDRNSMEHNTVFQNYVHYHVKYSNMDSVVSQLRFIVNANNINALYLRPEEEYRIVPKLKEAFPLIKFLITKHKVRNITDINEQKFLIINEHNRAHRGFKENYLQLKQQYFWPTLKVNIRTHTQTCEICLKNKYERRPKLQEIGETPIPKRVGEMLHMDIFFVDKQKYLTCVDKFSKHLQLFLIRSCTEIPQMIEQILIAYPDVDNITTDNESVFNSQMVNSLLETYKIRHHRTPVGHSITNGQIERTHSTILELARTLAEQRRETISEVIYRAVREYNRTIHSVTKQKPVELFFHSDKFPQVSEILKKSQEQTLKLQNRDRENKTYKVGDEIYVKTNRRRKSEPKYRKHIVKENLHNTVVDTKNKVVHKDNIRK